MAGYIIESSPLSPPRPASRYKGLHRFAMEFPKLDQSFVSRTFLGLLGLAFVVLTALGIHGSSVVMWSAILNEEATSHALLHSIPRAIRSDEWLVVTPSILAQARHEPSFPVENPALGAGRSPMLMNLPTRHFSTCFRPQLWGYFLFGVERGFAWNWNAKIFGLLAATFLLIRKLAGGNAWLALLGSLWIYASSYTQWWFSCPPMLPEMLASWALALWCVIKLLEAPRWPMSLAATAGLAVAGINFALSMYPPYQIPLTYLGLAILGGWIWQQRSQPPAAPRRLAPLAWLALAVGIFAAVVIPFFIELLPTLQLVQNTSYPGARRATGGALSAVHLFLGLADPFMSADHFPEKRENICNASNFYPVWLAAGGWLLASVGCGRFLRTRLLWPLFGSLLAFTLFALCPLPAFLGRLTLLSFTTEERLILPIGFGGILLSVLVLREIIENSIEIPRTRRLAVFAVCAGLAIALLLAAATENPKFFTNTRLFGAVALSLALFALYLWPLKHGFGILLLAVLLPIAVRVNPVTRGLGPLKDTTAFPAIDEIRRADPNAGWIAYDGAEGTNQSSLLASAGVNVLSGPKTLPDLALYTQLDPTRRELNIYNRYSLGLFHLAPRPEVVAFRLFSFCAHDVLIHPTNPALRSRQVRYFVFPKPLADPRAAGLKPLQALPERQMWIYRLAE